MQACGYDQPLTFSSESGLPTLYAYCTLPPGHDGDNHRLTGFWDACGRHGGKQADTGTAVAASRCCSCFGHCWKQGLGGCPCMAQFDRGGPPARRRPRPRASQRSHQDGRQPEMAGAYSVDWDDRLAEGARCKFGNCAADHPSYHLHDAEHEGETAAAWIAACHRRDDDALRERQEAIDALRARDKEEAIAKAKAI